MVKLRDGSADGQPQASLFDQLCAEYPEVSGRVVAEALERAHREAEGIGASTVLQPRSVTAFARDSLDVIRIRSAAAARRVAAAGFLDVARPPGAASPDAAGSHWAPRGLGGAEVGRFDRVTDAVEIRARALGVPVSADMVCQAAAAHLAVESVAVSVPGGLLTSQTIGAHGNVGRRMEELQVTLGEGPSLEGLATGAALAVEDLDAAVALARWPLFTPVAIDAGVCSLLVLPMRVGAARVGVVVLYLDRVGGLSAEALAEARTFAAVALKLMLEHAGPGAGPRGVDGEPTGDRGFFDDRPEIHQATGMVSVQLGVDLWTALLRLRARAYAEDRLLSELAADVVARDVCFKESA